MVNEVPFAIKSLKVDGGVTNNTFVMQKICDLNNVTVEKSKIDMNI